MNPLDFRPNLYKHIHPELAEQNRPFQAVQVSKGNVDDLVTWTEGTKADEGLVLPSGRLVPFGHWAHRQGDNHFFGMSPEGFESAFVPA